jgi:uncharacterized protein involved in type VI secretion and phage assembly
MKDFPGLSKWSVSLAVSCILILALFSTRPIRAQNAIPAGPPAFGLSRAIVVEISDPDAAGRIKVQFPWHRRELEAWALVSLPIGGNHTGLWALPRIGEEVVIGFEEGDPDRPLIIGSLWNGRVPPMPTPTSGP